MAAGIEVAEVASHEPSIAQDGSGGVGTIPVSLHHDRAAHGQFTDRWTFFLRLRVDDLAFDAFHRSAARPDHVVLGRIDEDGRSCFSQAQGLQDVDAEIVEIPHDSWIEARTAGREIAHLRSESLMHLLEQGRAGVDSDLAERAVECEHRGKKFLGDGAAFLNLLKYPL